MSKVSKRKRDMLVGKFCLTFDAEGVLHKQGQILGKVSDSRYLVRWFEWMFGEECSQSIVSVEDISHWEFYDTVEDWHDAAYRHQKSISTKAGA